MEPLATSSFLSLCLIFIYVHDHGFTSHKPRMCMSQALYKSPSSELQTQRAKFCQIFPFTWNLKMNMYKIMIGSISVHVQPVPFATFPSTVNDSTTTQNRTTEQYFISPCHSISHMQPITNPYSFTSWTLSTPLSIQTLIPGVLKRHIISLGLHSLPDQPIFPTIITVNFPKY